MKGFVDLHAHWVPGVDDGVETLEEGLLLLRGLYAAGFSRAVATPHTPAAWCSLKTESRSPPSGNATCALRAPEFLTLMRYHP